MKSFEPLRKQGTSERQANSIVEWCWCGSRNRSCVTEGANSANSCGLVCCLMASKRRAEPGARCSHLPWQGWGKPWSRLQLSSYCECEGSQGQVPNSSVGWLLCLHLSLMACLWKRRCWRVTGPWRRSSPSTTSLGRRLRSSHPWTPLPWTSMTMRTSPPSLVTLLTPMMKVDTWKWVQSGPSFLFWRLKGCPYMETGISL